METIPVRTESATPTPAVTINWSEVQALKVLNDKLLLEMHDGIVIEIRGLSRRKIDDTFAAYSRFVQTARSSSGLSEPPLHPH